MPNVITDNLDLWASTVLKKPTAGRGSNGGWEAYGVKKVRELILELAVRGKLVPQDLGDESAEILLHRMAEEKNLLVEKNAIKRPRKFPQISDKEVPYPLPEGWVWARIDDVGHDWGQKKPERDFLYIDVSAINNDQGVIESPSIVTAADAPSRARKIVHVGTVIYSTVRPYLKNICVVEEEYSPEPIASTAFAVVHPLQKVPGKFLAYYFRSPVFVKYVESVQSGIAYPAINDKQFFGGLVPLPPLSEQHRIVAKVDELVSLCDQLEQHQSDSFDTHQNLVETLLGTLSSVESTEELTEAWSYVAGHFDTLFTTEQSVDQLVQAILHLAITGRLTHQDADNESASVLLSKIAGQKERMIEEKMIRKQKKLPGVSDEEVTFPLPEGWVWARLQDVIDVRDGTHDSPKDAIGGNTYPLVTSKNFIDGTIDFDGARRISEKDHTEIAKRSLVEKYDILFSMIGGNLGNQVMVLDDLEFSVKNVALFKYYKKELTSPFFVKRYMEHLSRNLQEKAIGGAQPFVSLGFLRSLVIALPPIEEQHRIVSRVDELMTLCDDLRAGITDAQATQLKLADAIVEQAVA